MADVLLPLNQLCPARTCFCSSTRAYFLCHKTLSFINKPLILLISHTTALHCSASNTSHAQFPPGPPAPPKTSGSLSLSLKTAHLFILPLLWLFYFLLSFDPSLGASCQVSFLTVYLFHRLRPSRCKYRRFFL